MWLHSHGRMVSHAFLQPPLAATPSISIASQSPRLQSFWNSGHISPVAPCSLSGVPYHNLALMSNLRNQSNCLSGQRPPYNPSLKNPRCKNTWELHCLLMTRAAPRNGFFCRSWFVSDVTFYFHTLAGMPHPGCSVSLGAKPAPSHVEPYLQLTRSH